MIAALKGFESYDLRGQLLSSSSCVLVVLPYAVQVHYPTQCWADNKRSVSVYVLSSISTCPPPPLPLPYPFVSPLSVAQTLFSALSNNLTLIQKEKNKRKKEGLRREREAGLLTRDSYFVKESQPLLICILQLISLKINFNFIIPPFIVQGEVAICCPPDKITLYS